MSTSFSDFRGTERFELVRELGAGGMGVVYEARDRERGTRVALKTLRQLDARGLLRFKQEFRALQGIHHLNLVTLGDLVETSGHWFFTMELVEGTNFLQYVRGPLASIDFRGAPGAVGWDEVTEPGHTGGGVDYDRLRSTVLQLAGGLQALHAAGKVHRDVKPSNVQVTPDGRVVLLDFGLVTELGPAGDTTEANIVGTVAYMAPEQAAAKSVGPEADWYSVGVVLYEALTGRLPFQGPPLEVLFNKQSFEPVSPNELVAGLPSDLSQLCHDLLHHDPRERPTGSEVLARLGAHAPVAPVLPVTPPSVHIAPPFVGREAELSALHERFAASRQGQVAVIVEGESGIGKSALVRHFVDQVLAEGTDAVVLAGRCYERESVPYKAIDGVIDSLSRYLARLPLEHVASLLPRQAALLTQVFPVLRAIRPFAQAQPLPASAATSDPQELRARVFGAARELLARLADRHPLVVIVDDCQWADDDSLALVAELLREPDAPPLLFVATWRPDGGKPARLPVPARSLVLGPLSEAQAAELVARLGPTATGAAQAIAREAAGHPLFIEELARHAAPEGAPGVLLDDALRARVAALPAAARTVLEVVAVAGGPIREATVARAAGVTGDAFEQALSPLRAGRLVRALGGSAADVLEPYHDRVREAVLARLDAGVRRGHHRQLALALEALAGADAETLAVHWARADEPARAAGHARHAAEHAAAAFAFNRAVRLYRSVLELAGGEPDGDVRARLADALAAAGRGQEAAATYLELAHEKAASAPAEGIRLYGRAVEELLRAARIDEGVAALRHFLPMVGMRLPRRPIAALLLERARVRLQRPSLEDDAPEDAALAAPEVPQELATRIDVCWSAAAALGLSDHVFGAWFQARHYRESLRSGEPRHVSRALGLEAVFTSLRGVRQRERCERLLARSSLLAKRSGDAMSQAVSIEASAICAYQFNDWARTLAESDRTTRLLRDSVTGGWWHIDIGEMYALLALFYLGRLREMGTRVTAQLRGAEDRGDLFAATVLATGNASVVWLVRDDAAGARDATARAMRNWPEDRYLLQHLWALVARTHVDLYTGDGAAAWQRMDEHWPRLRRAFLLQVESTRIETVHLACRAALAAAAALPAGRAREPLLGRITRLARDLHADHSPAARALLPLTQAGVASLRGDEGGAARSLRAAVSAADASGMAMYAAAARRRLGTLLAGDEGRALVVAGDAWMHEQGVVDVERMAAMFAPGC